MVVKYIIIYVIELFIIYFMINKHFLNERNVNGLIMVSKYIYINVKNERKTKILFRIILLHI